MLKLRDRASPDRPVFSFDTSPPPSEDAPGSFPRPPGEFLPERDMHMYGAQPVDGEQFEPGRSLVRCPRCSRTVLEWASADHKREFSPCCSWWRTLHCRVANCGASRTPLSVVHPPPHDVVNASCDLSGRCSASKRYQNVACVLVVARTRFATVHGRPLFDCVTLTSGICSHVLDGTPLLAKKVKGDKRVDGKKRRASEGKWIAVIFVVVAMVLGGYRRSIEIARAIHPLLLAAQRTA